MIKLLILIAATAALYWFFPSKMAAFQEQATAVVHQGAVRAAELTEPPNTLDRILKELK
jgi:hypothetical protein